MSSSKAPPNLDAVAPLAPFPAERPVEAIFLACDAAGPRLDRSRFGRPMIIGTLA